MAGPGSASMPLSMPLRSSSTLARPARRRQVRLEYSWRSLSTVQGRLEEFPFTLDAVERVPSSVPEADTGTSRQVLDRAGDQDLSRPRQRAHPGGDVHRDPARAVLEHFAFPGMDPHPDLEPERLGGVDDRAGAADGLGGPQEGHEEAVPCGLDLAASIPLEVRSD